MEAIMPEFRVPRVLQYSSNLMLVLGGLSRAPLPPTASFQRELVSLPDGGSVALDWYDDGKAWEEEQADHPIILALLAMGRSIICNPSVKKVRSIRSGWLV